MIFWYFFLSILAISHCSSEIDADLERVLNSYRNREPECTFNYTIINSETIKFFPQCKKVYGILVFNEDTDLGVGEIRTYFQNLRKIYGGLRIENSSFTSISIFNTGTEITIYCSFYGVFILNNTNLEDGSLLSNMRSVSNDNMDLCAFRVENNKKLDMEKYCDNDEDFGRLMGMKTKGNLKDCAACQGDQITATNLNSYSNCESLYNGLKLYNITDLNGLSALSKVEIIHGDIDIQNTNIKTFSFLKSLKKWKVRSFKKVIINLQNNPEMKKLPVEFFRELENSLYGEIKIANFENLHPDFCLTIEEILMIFDYELSFLKLHAKLCDDIGNIGERRLCRFESMNQLPNGCNIILGDLIIENGDEENMSKLMKLELIVGSIIIRNTELKKFQHFGEVLCIIQFDDTKPVIQIVGNKQLKDPTMDEITNIITRESRMAVIQDNHPDIFSSGSCELVTEFYGFLQRKYRVRWNFTGGDCGERVEIKSCRGESLLMLLMISLVLAMNE